MGSGDEVRYQNACSLRISEAEQRKLAESIQNDRLQGRLSTIGAITLIGFAGLLGGSVRLDWLASRQRTQLPQAGRRLRVYPEIRGRVFRSYAVVAR